MQTTKLSGYLFLSLSAPKAIAIFLIRLYRLILSPWVGWHCRFSPTCSCYGEEAIRQHGALKGIWLTARRISRCHPWGGSGYDPVPAPETPTKQCRNHASCNRNVTA